METDYFIDISKKDNLIAVNNKKLYLINFPKPVSKTRKSATNETPQQPALKDTILPFHNDKENSKTQGEKLYRAR